MIVLQKVPVDRYVRPAVYQPGKRAVRAFARPLVPVEDLRSVRLVGYVNGRRVHFGGQHGGERAVLSHVRAAVRGDHGRRPAVDHDPKREQAKVFDPRPQYARYSSQRPQRYVREPAAVGVVVDERTQEFDFSRHHHDYPGKIEFFRTRACVCVCIDGRFDRSSY